MLGFAPLSVFPVSAIAQEAIRSMFLATAVVESNPSYVVYFSTEDFITGADDNPGNTPIEGTLVTALNLQRSIVGGNYGLGRFQSGFGTMEIIASDGSKDDMFDRYRPDGGRVALRIMGDGGMIKTSFLAFDGVGVRWAISRDKGSITVKDKSYKLDVPAQRSTYAGSGDLEGGTDLAGKRRPLALGYVRNVAGTPVVPVENLYDLNDGSIQAVTACRDRGAALTLSANYATTALLRAAALAGGQYATCLAEGRARVGGNPSTQTRFDVSGDAVGGFAWATADVVARLIACTTMAVPDGLVTETFDQVNAAQPAPIGYFVASDSSETVAEIIGKLMDSIGGWAGCRAQGKFEVGVLRAPDAAEPPSFIYSEAEGDILSIDRQPMPDFLSPPPSGWRIAYDRNWSKQDDIAGVVAAADPDLAAWLTKDTRYAAAGTAARNEATVESYFRNQPDAAAEAARRLALFGQNFNLYVVKVKDHVFLHEIGRSVKVTHSRFNLAGGRPLRNVSINDNTDDNAVELIGFG